ncbi:probable linoleate 9S-lipoxygenase 5 [Dendrobium catenatum]|uniref:Lipoxygenase n=1 Tax=Dendrobium catenatum TaxID=906689 RepID=A0A2I0W336_9ASPA|nr:probable linoleate 9S-lipoxygenase 5 [Dendrobium catenatum]PKU70072.1 putative linoleate 9S-lipoxygenase 5 [Dendrobium catenatum]
MIGHMIGNVLWQGTKVKGHLVLMERNVLDFNDFGATVVNSIQDFLGQQVSLQLVSATAGDSNNDDRGLVGEPAYLEPPLIPLLPTVIAGEIKFGVTFHVKEGEGIPGAVIVKNRHLAEFFLKSITIEDFPGKGRIHFDCNSWVYNVTKYTYDRVFFANDTYLPKDTPGPLRPYREEELQHLRGDDVSRQLEEWDRVYNYAYYNDLGNPDLMSGLRRPVLGGSDKYPYPRRGKTARPPTKTDPESESRLFSLDMNIYVPRDERFGHLKMSDFLGYTIKAVAKSLVPVLQAVFDKTPNTFDSYEDVLKLYEGGLPLPDIPQVQALMQALPLEMLKSILTPATGQRSFLKCPMPLIIHDDKGIWKTDEEFAREMLAGVNPVVIEKLKEFPPTSNLDPTLFGEQNSTITAEHIERNLGGLTAEQALNGSRLFIINYHDALMPYLSRINSTSSKIYATRTLLFLRDDDTLKPIAIELSLPHPEGEKHGAVSTVYTPADSGVEAAIWQLAKGFVAVNDYGVHQLISHWLRTHAVMEPFVISTNRHLSTLHPINKLLVPHYRDTMNINALARQALINAGGIIEFSVFPSTYAMELSSVIYKSWNFADQSLPADLLKRGMAVEDPSSPTKLRLVIKDYPYAVDGLAIWSEIESWVTEYCSIYYPDDSIIRDDAELQSWWKEAVEVGHGDLKNKPWWPKLNSLPELVHICSTIIWIASAMHAAVNFGQYPYGGYLPNRPSLSRQFMPEVGTADYELLKTNPDKVFLKTITGQLQAILEISVIEILSTHASDELYLGQRASEEWTNNARALNALKRFGSKLKNVEKRIAELNKNKSLKNRGGSVKLDYELLSPYSGQGLTAKGIPNSISI